MAEDLNDKLLELYKNGRISKEELKGLLQTSSKKEGKRGKKSHKLRNFFLFMLGAGLLIGGPLLFKKFVRNLDLNRHETTESYSPTRSTSAPSISGTKEKKTKQTSSNQSQELEKLLNSSSYERTLQFEISGVGTFKYNVKSPYEWADHPDAFKELLKELYTDFEGTKLSTSMNCVWTKCYIDPALVKIFEPKSYGYSVGNLIVANGGRLGFVSESEIGGNFPALGHCTKLVLSDGTELGAYEKKPAFKKINRGDKITNATLSLKDDSEGSYDKGRSSSDRSSDTYEDVGRWADAGDLEVLVESNALGRESDGSWSFYVGVIHKNTLSSTKYIKKDMIKLSVDGKEQHMWRKAWEKLGQEEGVYIDLPPHAEIKRTYPFFVTYCGGKHARLVVPRIRWTGSGLHDYTFDGKVYINLLELPEKVNKTK